jgi:hypothetical protein
MLKLCSTGLTPYSLGRQHERFEGTSSRSLQCKSESEDEDTMFSETETYSFSGGGGVTLRSCQ